MKKLMMIAAAVLMFSACDEENQDIQNELVGEWRWIHSIGGLSGNDTLMPANGDTMTLLLNADLTYEYRTNGQMTSDGDYALLDVTSIQTNAPAPAIRFDAVQENDKLIELNGSSLMLTDNHTDYYTSYYVLVP